MTKQIGLALVSAGVYFACAGVSYALAIRPAGVVIVWFPAGVMLAALALLPRRAWPAVLSGATLGNVAADLMNGSSLPISVAGGLTNSVESLLAASLLVWWTGTPVALTRVREVLALVAGAAGASNALTALIGALVLVYGSGMPFARGWFVWWTGDGMGMLTVAPAVLSVADLVRNRVPFSRGRAIEAAGFFVVLVMLAQLVLSRAHDPSTTLTAEPTMLVPILFWAAVRFGLPGATMATLVVTVVTVWNASQAIGPFVQASQSATNQVLQIYAFLALASLSSLVPASVLSERAIHAVERARLAAILEAAPDFVTIGRLAGPPLYINLAARRALGIGAHEEVPSLLAFRKPGFAEYLETQILPIAIRDGSWRGETEYVARTGAVIPVSQVSIVHNDARGEAELLSTISRDISDRQQMEEALRHTEERMRFALEAAGVGIWEATLKTKTLFWSATCERMHGLAPGTFAGTHQAYLDRVHPDDRGEVVERIERAGRERTDTELEYRTIWPDGSVHLISTTGRTIYDAEGVPIRAAGIALDITDRRSLETQLRQAQRMEAIGQLAGGVAHDFNNILMAILGYTELVLGDLPVGHRNRHELEEISRAAHRAAELTQQLLAFSRKQILAPHVLRVGDIVQEVLPLLHRLLGESIDVKAAIDDRWHVKADPAQLGQVIVNLGVNARDAMPEGGRITIETRDLWLDDEYARLHPGSVPGPHVMIAVSDTGHGMDAATQKRIFEPFFTTKPKGQGTGLGLSMVYGVVQQSGGQIWVYSEPGRGTSFKIYLPRSEGVAKEAEARPDRLRVAGGNETVLVVEDEDVVRDVIERLLTNSGYHVLGVGHPREAIELATTRPDTIHLILSDVVLPQMSGPTMVVELLRVHRESKVLFMSGYTDNAIEHHGFLDAGTSFLQKPFSGDALLRKVREVLDTP